MKRKSTNGVKEQTNPLSSDPSMSLNRMAVFYAFPATMEGRINIFYAPSISISYASRRPVIPVIENFAFLIRFLSGLIE